LKQIRKERGYDYEVCPPLHVWTFYVWFRFIGGLKFTSKDHPLPIHSLIAFVLICSRYRDNKCNRSRAFESQSLQRKEGTAKFTIKCWTGQDILQVSPEKLENYETKIRKFYEEHIHTDEEIRYCLDGSGQFTFLS
jgi:hypothetical protein